MRSEYRIVRGDLNSGRPLSNRTSGRELNYQCDEIRSRPSSTYFYRKKIGRLAIFKENDQEIGMEEDTQEVIFDRFERVQGNQNIRGLGSFIAKQRVYAHTGSIHVESRLGEGSTFTVSLFLESKEADFRRTNQELA